MSATRFSLLVVFVSVAGGGCGSASKAAYDGPTDEERALRAAFIESHPELPTSVKVQLRNFDTRPQDVLRRVDYLRANPNPSKLRRELVLHGNVRIEMQEADVRASWGEPEEVEPSGEGATWIYPVFSRRGHDRKVRLRFARGILVNLRRD